MPLKGKRCILWVPGLGLNCLFEEGRDVCRDVYGNKLG